MSRPPLKSIEICAGAGGQALGLHEAGFEHVALVENDPWACETLRSNSERLDYGWRVFGPYADDRRYRREGQGDVRRFDATPWRDEIDLLAGGVPCPPFSKAGKQLGADDERDLFPAALDLVDDCRPKAVMLENVPGILDRKFAEYRKGVEARLERDYDVTWLPVQSSNYGVPQLRPRAILVAIAHDYAHDFIWPNQPSDFSPAPTVGEALLPYMSVDSWWNAEHWATNLATRIAPTLVGGSKKHGGPDLGPTRAKREWAKLGVNAMGLADAPPAADFDGPPKLTVDMAAVIQGFKPDEWKIAGRKTNAYRQVGNAFPPPVANAFGERIKDALLGQPRRELTVTSGAQEVDAPPAYVERRVATA